MKRETIRGHAGYDGDPTTKAVAVPIYQTSLEFDSANMALLCSISKSGKHLYPNRNPPIRAGKRVAALEGGVDGLSVSSGMAAIEYSLIILPKLAITSFLLRSYMALLTRCSPTFSVSAAIEARLERQTNPKTLRMIDEKYPRRLLRKRRQSRRKRGRH